MATKSEASEAQTTDVIVWLDPPIPPSQELAGQSWDVRVGGVPMVLMTPLESRECLTHPQDDPSRGPFPRFPDPSLAAPFTSEARTFASTSLGVPAGVLAPAAIRLRFAEPELAGALAEMPGAHKFSVTIGDWLATVRDWLAAWSGQDREPIEHEGTPVILAATPAGQLHGAGGTPLVLRPLRPASPSQWRAAIAAASNDAPLPLEHRLIAEAFVLGYRQQYRHSVITAASAAEVALARAAKARFASAGWPEQDVDELLKGPGGLVELYRLNAVHNRLPVSIRRVRNQLADRRNLAAHSGVSPDRPTVDRAIITARALLDEVSPLPQPESFL